MKIWFLCKNLKVNYVAYTLIICVLFQCYFLSIHITFTTERGLLYYKVIPFGLKNAGATYQRLMNKMFVALLGKTKDIYIDDMVIKSKEQGDHIRDLDECF